VHKKFLKIFVFLLLVARGVNAQNPTRHIPAFTFYKLNDSSFTNKDVYRGKKIFFVFFDSGCEHCQRAMHDIDLHFNKFKQASVYLITLDGSETIKNFMSAYAPDLVRQPNVTMLRDLKNEFIMKFNPRKYPSMLLYSPKGSLIAYEDDDSNISKIYNRL
jgi:peroxiredoxin